MNLTDDAMQVSLRITALSGRLYHRQASNHVAVHHDAAASVGRYKKCLLSKAAFAALTATVSACRTAHYENTLLEHAADSLSPGERRQPHCPWIWGVDRGCRPRVSIGCIDVSRGLDVARRAGFAADRTVGHRPAVRKGGRCGSFRGVVRRARGACRGVVGRLWRPRARARAERMIMPARHG